MIQPNGLPVAERATVQRFVTPSGVPFAQMAKGGVMRLTLLGENELLLEPTEGPMNIEALTADQSYSPFHMLAGGLAYCTWSVLASWASQAKIDVGDLTIDVKWTFAEDPHRVGAMDVQFKWPSLPANRL